MTETAEKNDPVEPMKEGPAHAYDPAWLARHRDDIPARRAALPPEKQIFFDSLVARARGEAQPALSGRERLALMAILGGAL